MVKYLIFLFVFFVFLNNIYAQLIHSTYILKGTINTDSGKIKLLGVGDDTYYSLNSSYKEAKIDKGKFIFTDSIPYPYAFRLRLDIGSTPRYMSDIFIIDSGIQTIRCNIDSIWEIPFLTNNSMIEFNEFLSTSNEQSRMIEKKETILLEYTKEHPNSYVALWKLIDKLSSGYEPILDSIYTQFSDSIKTTYTGKILAEKLSASRVTGVGHIFPKLLLFNEKNNKVSAPSTTNHIFTLIDFWFSHCTPCISQFNELKSIYTNFKTKGFQIIGISVDMKSDIYFWRKIIKEKGLNWDQYLDEDGKLSKPLGINSFPTNFLLNEKGEIIQKNITPEELENFLKVYLHQYKKYDKLQINEPN